MKYVLLTLIFFSITISFLIQSAQAVQNFTIINASSCSDTGGDCQLSNVQLQDGVTESQSGHNSQARFIQTGNINTTAISSPNSIDNVTVYIDRFESANPGGQTITLQVTRTSDGTSESRTLSAKTTNDSTYDGFDVTSLITGSSSPESDAESLTIRYTVTALGNGNTLHLDHTYVNITHNDTSGPVVILGTPNNDTWTNSSNVTFRFTPNDVTSGISSCTLILNNTANQTNSTITENIVNNITTSLNQGSYNWTVNCTDTSANRNVGTNASIRLLRVDTTNASITLNSPANVTNTSQRLQIFNFTATDNLASSLACGLYINSTAANSTTATNNTPTTISYSLPEGRHTWYVRCEDSAVNANVSETRNITIDFTNISVSNITHLPSSDEVLDPNTTVNVTTNVSDNIEIHNILLQYKLQSETTWSEVNMTLQSGNLYLGRFNATEGNWSFRVFANDTANNQNISDMTNISVINDATWTNTSTLSSVHSIVQTDDRFFSLGNITVNNTGDFNLTFVMNSSQTWIDFNGTTGNSISFGVNRSYNYSTINVTANTTGFALGEFNFNVTIFGFNNSVLISSQRIPGKVVIQNVAGPYFTVTITNFDSTVIQGDTGVILTATVKNDGTGDASQTWIGWTLPSQWTNTSGALNRTIGVLGVGSTVTNNITVSVSSSASTGTQTILAAANSAEYSPANDSKTITINTNSSSSSPASAPVSTTSSTGGGGGGGGIGAVVEKVLSREEILKSTDRFDLVRGFGSSFPFTVKNIFERTRLYNVSIKIEGLLPHQVKISPALIGQIDYNEAKDFNITILSPEYTEQGTRKISVLITGKVVGPGVNRDFVENKSITLVTHTISRDDAQKILELAAEDISKMANVGFPTKEVSKILEQAKAALDENDYEKADGLGNRIISVTGDAFESYALIQEVRDKARSYVSITGAFLGVQRKFSETEEIVNLALAAFEREDFGAALERAKSAKLTLALEGKDFSAVFFLVDYWWAILIGIAAASAGGTFGYRFYLSATISQKIINLGKEEEGIRKLMKEAQRRHFQEKTMGSGSFQKMMKGYQERLAKITQLRLKMRHRRVRLMSPQNLLQDLERESREITNILKRLQREYFERREISKPAYDEQVKAYNRRLSEIEEERLVLETRTPHGGGEE